MAQSTQTRVLFAWRLLAILLALFAEWFFHLGGLLNLFHQFSTAGFPYFVQVCLIICSLVLTRIFRHDISLRQFKRDKQKDHIASAYLKSVCVCLAAILSVLLVAVLVTTQGNDGEGLSFYRSVLGACSTFYTLLFLETMIIRNEGKYTLGTSYRLLAATVNLIGLDVVRTHAGLLVELLYLLYLASDSIVYYSLFLKATSTVGHADPRWLRASYYCAGGFLIIHVGIVTAIIVTRWSEIEELEKIFFFACELGLWLPCQCWNVLVYRKQVNRLRSQPDEGEAAALLQGRALGDPLS
jgi:hypothetical protein